MKKILLFILVFAIFSMSVSAFYLSDDFSGGFTDNWSIAVGAGAVSIESEKLKIVGSGTTGACFNITGNTGALSGVYNISYTFNASQTNQRLQIGGWGSNDSIDTAKRNSVIFVLNDAFFEAPFNTNIKAYVASTVYDITHEINETAQIYTLWIDQVDVSGSLAFSNAISTNFFCIYGWDTGTFYFDNLTINNESAPPPPPPIDSDINITLNSPVNASTSNNATQIFIYNITSNIPIRNCSLWENFSGTWKLNQTNTSIILNNTLNNFTINSLKDGYYKWNINCFNSSFWAASNFTLTIDTTSPILTGTSFKNLSTFMRNLSAQFNFSDERLLFSVNITIPEDDIIIFNQTNINTTTFILNISRDISDIPNGTKTLSVTFADAHTANELLSSASYDYSNGLFGNYVEYTFTKPYKEGSIKIIQKSGSVFDSWETQELEDRYTFSFEPNTKRTNYTFEVEAEGKIDIIDAPNTEYKKWLVYQNHWLDFYPYTDVNIKRIRNNLVEVTINNVDDKQNKFTFSSVGDLNIVQINYTFFAVNATETFSSVIFNGLSTDLILDLFAVNLAVPELVLFEFNATTNTTPSLLINNDAQKRYKVTIIPNITTLNSTPVNHRWYVLFNSTIFNVTDKTTLQTQTVINSSVGRCDSTRPVQILNVSYFDEQNQSIKLFPTNSFNLVITDGTSFFNQTGIWTSSDNHSFCTNVPTSLLNISWSMSNDMEVSLPLYETRFYNIPSGSPVTISNNPSTNLSIFLVNSSESSTVEYSWTTTEFQLIDGVMKIFKCNPDGSEVLTDSIVIVSGRAAGNIQLFSTLYKYTVTIGATTFSQPSFSTCHVETSTSVTYRVNILTAETLNNIGLLLTDCNLERIGNNSVNMTWGTSAQNTGTIIGCLGAYRGSNQIFQQNCSNSSNRFVVMEVADTSSTYYVSGTLQQGNNIVACGETISFFRKSEAQELFGNTGIFASILLICSLFLLFVGEGKGFMAAAGLGIIVSWIVGILAFNWIIVSTLIGFLIVITLIGKNAGTQ